MKPLKFKGQALLTNCQKGNKHLLDKKAFLILTSFKQAAKQASLVEVKMRESSLFLIILLGTLSKVHGLEHTFSEKERESIELN